VGGGTVQFINENQRETSFDKKLNWSEQEFSRDRKFSHRKEISEQFS